MLLQDNLVVKRGIKKGTCYYINPKLIKNAKAGIKTTLKTVEPHVLKTLVYEDLRLHPDSGVREIIERLKDADIRDVRKILYAGVESGELEPHGASKNRTYTLVNGMP